jgi:NADH-quinone oxidoreductase subunit G
LVLTGNLAVSHPQYSALRALSVVIAENTGAKVGSLVESANSAGAWLAGAIPHRQAAGVAVEKVGKNADEMLREGSKLFILLDVEPEFDCADPQQASTAMDQAECVIAITPFVTDRMKEYADILLPVASFAETSGTFVNAEGHWQSFTGAIRPVGEARPAWKVLRVLGNVLELEGFDYISSKEICNALKQKNTEATPAENAPLMPIYQKQAVDAGLQRISEVAMYCTDSLVRRATALHKRVESEEASIRLSVSDAERLGLKNGANISITQNNAKAMAKLVIDQSIPAGCVLIPEGTEVSANLGASFGTVNISAA